MEERLVTITDILLTHGHTDHYTGLINILMTKLSHFQTSGVHFPTRIFYPEDDRTLQLYLQYIQSAYRLKNSPLDIQFIPVKPGERHHLDVRKRSFLEVLPVVHTKDVAAVGYRLGEVRTKLLDEYSNLPQKEIQQLIGEKGKEAITYEMDKHLIVYSGDTKPLTAEAVGNAEFLLHEATFLKPMDRKSHQHSTIDEVMELASTLPIKHLILYHFSSRYTADQIASKLHRFLPIMGEKKVHFVVPGKTFQLN
jgi:ribonuclease Z